MLQGFHFPARVKMGGLSKGRTKGDTLFPCFFVFVMGSVWLVFELVFVALQ